MGARCVRRVRRRSDSTNPRDQDRSGRARLLARRDARHGVGDRRAAGTAGIERERAGSAEGSGARLGRVRQSSSREPPRRRSGAVARRADRRWPLAHELRASSAGGAGLRAGGRVYRATRTAAAAVPARETRRLLRAAVPEADDTSGQHVGRVDRPSAAHRRTDTGAGGDWGPLAAAAERAPASQPSSRLAEVFQHARHSHSRRTRFRRTRQRARAARGHRQRDLRAAAFPRRGPRSAAR